MILGTSKGCYKFSFAEEFKQGKTCDAVEERMQSANKAFWKDIDDIQEQGCSVEGEVSTRSEPRVRRVHFWK